MIPKIIHYCWLSGEPLPANLQKCINSWKRMMPDYQIIKWDMKRFDINSVPLVRQAVAEKKWAFAADYIRTYALYNLGGIYLDSDVMLYKNLEDLYDGEFITGFEYHPNVKDMDQVRSSIDSNGIRISKSKNILGVGIQAAILISVPKHQLLKDILDFYNQTDLNKILSNRLLAPTVYAFHCEKYGFRYLNKKQCLDEHIVIFPTSVISNYNQFTANSYAVHWCAGSWTQSSLSKRIMNKIKSNPLFLKLYIRFRGNIFLK